MSALVTTFQVILLLIVTAYIWYVTIQGARTGILRGRGRIERSTSPRLFWVALVAYASLSVVCLGGLGVFIYGETHPEWRRPHQSLSR
jgi:hypothetical protein